MQDQQYPPNHSNETTVVTETPFDVNSETVKNLTMSAIGAAATTVVVAAGVIFVSAGALKLVTFVIGGIASIMIAVAPWLAVILGICAFSAYSK